MNQILYNCHTDSDRFRITKFNDGEVESSYLCSLEACECPAGHRPSCRHRHMLPRFLAKGAVNTFYFYDYDRQGWVTNEPAIANDPMFSPVEPTLTEFDDPMREEFLAEAKAEYEATKPIEPPSFERQIDSIAALVDPTKLRRRL